MRNSNVSEIHLEQQEIDSAFLKRKVQVDFYLPANVERPEDMSLLLINDGQDMEKMGFKGILNEFCTRLKRTRPIFCAAIHCGTDRKQEYGVASVPDFAGRGSRALEYSRFIIEELLPFIEKSYFIPSFKQKVFAGFSLGGLSALDIVWKYPEIFSKAGVFSGSLWWRSIDQTEKEYDDDKHRIMHQEIRNGNYNPGQKFFFQCGNMDETADRNNNGIIDSIEDTMDIIDELVAKGYDRSKDISYLEYPDGKHDVDTWARAMPEFFGWAFA